MKQFSSQGIVLHRTDYGEADRILTFITPDHGKIKALAKGVRKTKSKLAGGIELFSVSEISFVIGRSKINTLISTRLLKHFGNLIKDAQRTQYAYDFIKMINSSTEDSTEKEYFDLLDQGLADLNNLKIEPCLVNLWFKMKLLKISGHEPNLKSDIHGQKLKLATGYSFQLDRMRFSPKESSQGVFTDKHIKFLRIGFSASKSEMLGRVEGASAITSTTEPLVQAMLRQFVQI